MNAFSVSGSGSAHARPGRTAWLTAAQAAGPAIGARKRRQQHSGGSDGARPEQGLAGREIDRSIDSNVQTSKHPNIETAAALVWAGAGRIKVGERAEGRLVGRELDVQSTLAGDGTDANSGSCTFVNFFNPPATSATPTKITTSANTKFVAVHPNTFLGEVPFWLVENRLKPKFWVTRRARLENIFYFLNQISVSKSESNSGSKLELHGRGSSISRSNARTGSRARSGRSPRAAAESWARRWK